MTHSVAWYDESQLLYVGVRVRGVDMQPDEVTAQLGLTPTRTLTPAHRFERDIDGTDLDIELAAEWIRETPADSTPGTLNPQVDAALKELEAKGIAFRTLENVDACEFCIGILPGKNKRTSANREEPLHELDQRIDALGLTLSVREVYPGMTPFIGTAPVCSDTYWLEHGELRYVSFQFTGPTLSPAAITEAIGLAPSGGRETGVKSHMDLDDTLFEYAVKGSWYRTMRMDPTPGALLLQIEIAVAELEVVGETCRTLCAAFEGQFFLGISPATSELYKESRGALPWVVMKRVQALGFMFAMSTEFSGD